MHRLVDIYCYRMGKFVFTRISMLTHHARFFYWHTRLRRMQSMYAYNAQTLTIMTSQWSHCWMRALCVQVRRKNHASSNYWMHEKIMHTVITGCMILRRMYLCMQICHASSKFLLQDAWSEKPVNFYLFWEFLCPFYKTDDAQAFFVDQWDWMHSLTSELV